MTFAVNHDLRERHSSAPAGGLPETIPDGIMLWEVTLRTLLDGSIRRLGLSPLSLAFEEGFPPNYRAIVAPRLAVRDVLRLESVLRSGKASLDLRAPAASDAEPYHRLMVYSDKPHVLDAIIP